MKKLIENTTTVALTIAALANYRNLFDHADFELDLKGIRLELERDLSYMPQ